MVGFFLSMNLKIFPIFSKNYLWRRCINLVIAQVHIPSSGSDRIQELIGKSTLDDRKFSQGTCSSASNIVNLSWKSEQLYPLPPKKKNKQKYLILPEFQFVYKNGSSPNNHNQVPSCISSVPPTQASLALITERKIAHLHVVYINIYRYLNVLNYFIWTESIVFIIDRHIFVLQQRV